MPRKPAWQRAAAEVPIRPDMPIIDSHHHFWDDRSLALVYGRALPEDMAAMIAASGHKIAATAFVECKWKYCADGPEALRCVGETEAVEAALRVAETHGHGPTRIPAAIMGFAELLAGDKVAAVLEAHVAASPDKFRGIRYVTSSDADEPYGRIEREGALAAPALRDALRWLDRMGLIFETWCLHTQIDGIIALADAFPRLTIVVDHLATPIRIGRYADRQQDAWAEWKAGLAVAAQRPNIAIKLGGFGMAVAGYDWKRRETPPDSSEIANVYRPYVLHAVDVFSPARCMFESNFPVDGIAHGYGTLWNAFKRVTEDMSAESKMRSSAALPRASTASTARTKALQSAIVASEISRTSATQKHHAADIEPEPSITPRDAGAPHLSRATEAARFELKHGLLLSRIQQTRTLNLGIAYAAVGSPRKVSRTRASRQARARKSGHRPRKTDSRYGPPELD